MDVETQKHLNDFHDATDEILRIMAQMTKWAEEMTAILKPFGDPSFRKAYHDALVDKNFQDAEAFQKLKNGVAVHTTKN